MPQWCVNRLFEMITRGECEAALIAGGETLATQKAAERAGLKLDWSEDAGGEPEIWGVAKRGWNDMEDRHRMAGAIFAYPMFENGIRGHLGPHDPRASRCDGKLFAHFAAVAKANPLADRRAGYSAEAIATVSADNPYIGFPYTKLMNANAFIDQAAADRADVRRESESAGHSRGRNGSISMAAPTRTTIGTSPTATTSIPRRRCARLRRKRSRWRRSRSPTSTKFDLYSCFPSAVEIACEEMGIPARRPARAHHHRRPSLLRRARQQLRHPFDRRR